MSTDTLAVMDKKGRKCFRCHRDIAVGETVAVERLPGGAVSFSHASCAAKNDPKAAALIAEGNLTLSNETMAKIVELVGEELSTLVNAETVRGKIEKLVKPTLSGLIEAAIQKLRPVQISINVPGLKRTTKTTGEIYHPAFEDIVRMLSAGLNVFIPGPTGCGKTHIAGQVAKAMGLDFYPMSMAETTSESQLFGRQIPNLTKGTYTYYPSPFIKAFTEGGVCLLDELDAADPNVLLSMNMALDNKVVVVHADSDSPIKEQHKDFRLIAGANTLGRGSNQMYVGRNQLDGATLDRFAAGFLPIDYAPELDAHLCPDEELRTLLVGYRKPIVDHRLSRAISYRTLRNGSALQNAGYSIPRIERQVFASWTESEIAKVSPRYRSEWKTEAV